MAQFDMPTFHVVAPLPSLNRRTRLAKLMQYLDGRNWGRVVHAGWSRESGDFLDPDLSVEKVCLVKGGGYGTRFARVLYFLWGLRVFFYCLRIPRRDLVWALGLESAFPAAMASRVRGFSVVFDDADRFAMLFNWPPPIRWFIELVEKLTSRLCSVHAVPNLSRYDYESKSFFLLENVPSKAAVGSAMHRARELELPVRSRVVLNINGWLGSGRGMLTALRAVQGFSSDDLTVLLVGKLACEEADQIARLPIAIAVGEVKYSESLAWFYRSDLILTYYDPSDPINIKAQSNKWGDALLTGAGIIVNSEVERSRNLVALGSARAIPYEDHDGLASFLRECVADRSLIDEMRASAARHGAEMMLFDNFLDRLFSQIGRCGHETSSQD